jgi:hypothetical protein
MKKKEDNVSMERNNEEMRNDKKIRDVYMEKKMD